MVIPLCLSVAHKSIAGTGEGHGGRQGRFCWWRRPRMPPRMPTGSRRSFIEIGDGVDNSPAVETPGRHGKGAGGRGAARAKVVHDLDPHRAIAISAEAETSDRGSRIETRRTNDEIEVLTCCSRSVVPRFEQYVKLNKKVPPEILSSLSSIDDAFAVWPTPCGRPSCRCESDLKNRSPAGDLSHIHARVWKQRDWSASMKKLTSCRIEKAHSRASQAADGEEPARVLSQRADEGDSERAGGYGRLSQRSGRSWRAENR